MWRGTLGVISSCGLSYCIAYVVLSLCLTTVHVREAGCIPQSSCWPVKYQLCLAIFALIHKCSNINDSGVGSLFSQTLTAGKNLLLFCFGGEILAELSPHSCHSLSFSRSLSLSRTWWCFKWSLRWEFVLQWRWSYLWWSKPVLLNEGSSLGKWFQYQMSNQYFAYN